MANIEAIHSVTNSIVSYLRDSYQEEDEEQDCTFLTLSSQDLANDNDRTTAVSLYLYRVSISEHLRNQGRDIGADPPTPLSLELRYLLTVWAVSADVEHTLLAWAMRQLHISPILDPSILSQEAEWRADDYVHLIADELSNEDLMRIWDAVTPSYRLSYPYVARVVRIDPEEVGGKLPVVATRHTLGAHQAEGAR